MILKQIFRIKKNFTQKVFIYPYCLCIFLFLSVYFLEN